MGDVVIERADTEEQEHCSDDVTPAPTPTIVPAARSVRIRGTEYPVLLPKLRDARLHVAAVTISVHVLGQVGLGFQVSVPQILASMLTCFVLGAAIEFRRHRAFVWPASALLTGSGIALILRVPDTPLHDHWTFHKWYVFAGVAAFAIVVRQLVQYRGNPLFNPSNVALVATFLVLGSSRVAPLDFWWAPLNGWMIAAYVIIVGGGALITRRLGVLVMAGTFWVTFSAALSLLATTGHCMTANWAFAPVCGGDQWRAIVTSPEVMIFTFFMVTDPKTVPRGRVGRPLFAAMVALACVLLISPQTTEFGAKVGLLGGLTLLCACRPLFDRLVPEPGSDDDRLRTWASRVLTGRASGRSPLVALTRLAAIAAVLVLAGVGVVAAGRSAKGVFADERTDLLSLVPHAINPDTFPDITVDQGVLDWNHTLTGDGARAVVQTLAENLEIENAAMLRHDASLLTAVDHGDRLDAMKAQLADADTTGVTVVRHYVIDSIDITLIVPFGRQDGLSLGLHSQGTLTKETYDRDGHLTSSESTPFATTFVLRRATGGRWLNVAELPFDATV